MTIAKRPDWSEKERPSFLPSKIKKTLTWMSVPLRAVQPERNAGVRTARIGWREPEASSGRADGKSR